MIVSYILAEVARGLPVRTVFSKDASRIRQLGSLHSEAKGRAESRAALAGPQELSPKKGPVH